MVRNTVKTALAGLVFAAAMGGGTAAMAANKEAITIHNNTGGAVWVTIYGVTKDKYAWGCAGAHGTLLKTLSLTDMADSWGGIYVRYEYKQNADCTGKTNHDSHYGGLIGISTSGKMDQYVPAR